MAAVAAAVVAVSLGVAWLVTGDTEPGALRWRACTSGDIDVAAGRQDAYHGHATQLFSLTNVAASDCRLTGPPRIVATAPSGAQPVAPGRYADMSLPLRAGAEALVVAGGPASCGRLPAEDIARDAEVSVACGPARRFADVWLPLGCGAPRLLVFQTTR